MKLLWRNAECNMGNILRVSHIFQLKASEIITKYEKRGKYLPILHNQQY